MYLEVTVIDKDGNEVEAIYITEEHDTERDSGEVTYVYASHKFTIQIKVIPQ